MTSTTSHVDISLFVDSSAYDQNTPGDTNAGAAGDITISTGGNLSGGASIRADGGIAGGTGGVVQLTAVADMTLDFVSASATLPVATGSGNAGSITITTGTLLATSLRTQGGPSSGNGGDIIVDATGGIHVTSFVDSEARNAGNGGLIDFSAGGIQIDSFVRSASFAGGGNAGNISLIADGSFSTGDIIAHGSGVGNGGSVTISGDTVETWDILTYGGSTGNGNNVLITATGVSLQIIGDINAGANAGDAGNITATSAGLVFIDGFVSTAADVNGGDISVTANSGAININSFVSSRSRSSGNGGDIVLSATGLLSVLAASTINDGLNSAIASNGGGTGSAGNITLVYNSSISAPFVIDSTNGTVKGPISARGIGSGNGGIITLINSGGNLPVTLNSTVTAISTSGGTSGSVNFNYLQSGISVATNPSAVISVVGTGSLVGPVYASGTEVTLNLTTANSTLTIGSVEATAEDVTITTAGTASSITLNSGSTITAADQISLNTASVTNNGSVSGVNILINSEDDLTLSGNGSFIGSPGSTLIYADVLTFSANADLTFTSNPVNFYSTSIVFGSNVTITADNPSGSLWFVGNGSNLNITLPSNGVVTISNAGGVYFDINGDGATLSASSTGNATLQTTGSTRIQFNADVTVNSNVTINSDDNLTIGGGTLAPVVVTNHGALIANGTMYMSSGSDLTVVSDGTLEAATIDLTASTPSSVTATLATTVGTITASANSIEITASAPLTLGTIQANEGSATIIADGDIHVTNNIYVNEGNLVLQDLNTVDGFIQVDSDVILSATTTGTTLGRVFIFIGAGPPAQTNTTTPANINPSTPNDGHIYYGANSITASAPTNNLTADGSSIVFDSGALPSTAISLGGNVTINATAQPSGEGPIYSLDFTDPNLTALIIQLQGESQIGGTLIVNGQGVATGGNAIIGANMLSNTLTGTNIPTGVTITFEDFTLSDNVNVQINEESHSNVGIIAGTLQFTGSSPSAGLITVNSNQASASGNPAFVLTGTGLLTSDGSLSLSASGNMLLQGTLTAATNLTLATTANNGNINITGSVTATNSATLSTNGNGTVTGTIDTPTLNFSSTMGNLGTSGSRFVTTSDSLGISTGGDAYINNTSTGTLSLGATSARNFDLINDHAVTLSSTLQASQSASILVTGNNGGVTLNGNFTAPNWVDMVANGSGDIVQNAGTLRTSSVYLKSGSGNIGSSGSPIQTNAFYTTFITSGGEVHLNSSNSIRVHNASSGSVIDITSNGQIEVAQPITSSSSVTFHGAGTIILSANITATSFTSLYGNGHGNILNNGGSIITPVLTTSTGSGNIGSNTTAIDTTATTITSTNQGGNNTNITGGGSQTTNITDITAASVNVTSDGSLNVGNVQSTYGSIQLTGSGTITVTEGSTIHANEGDITIHNNNETGTINLEQNSTIEAYTNNSGSGLGNVTITVGNSIGTSGTTGANVTTNIQGGGQIVVGDNGFTADAPNNTINAIGATVTIDAGASGTIHLGGGVTITADPPITASISSSTPIVAAVRAEVSAPAQIANVLPLLTINTTSSAAATAPSIVRTQVVTDATILSSPFNMQVNLTNSLPGITPASSTSILNNINKLNTSNTPTTPTQLQADDSEPTAYLPIAYTTTAPSNSTIVNSIHEISKIDFGSCNLRHAGNADVRYNANGGIILHSGEVLIHSPHQTVINAGAYTISIDSGSVALITRENNVVKVRALHESHTNAIVITVGNNPLKLSVGQEVILAPNTAHLQAALQKESLGRRHVVDAELPNGHSMSRSEFSHIGLMEQSHVLSKLIQSKSPADKQLADKLVKTAACLMTVTGAHGAYSGK
ncbi:MAG: hypothetical protein K2Y22_09735 [Candidatus Obscuribacterales bacterium]|nr:hypothetical protein [Candidatus Obscuribacterales bacterium]